MDRQSNDQKKKDEKTIIGSQSTAQKTEKPRVNLSDWDGQAIPVQRVAQIT